MLKQALKVATSPSLSRTQRAFVDRVVRVDQAGELGADLIYAGQHFVFQFTNPGLAPLIKHMWNQEIHHHNTFDTLQIQGRTRPSLLTPAWKVASLFMGVSTALVGKEAAMACTEAVETVIGGHYNKQIRTLQEEFPDSPEVNAFKSLLSEFRDEELEHLDTAVQNDAHKAVPYIVLTESIKMTCRTAVFLAERI